MSGAAAQLPRPRLGGLTAEFYGWLGKGELRVQRCTECATHRHIPRYLCPECGSQRWEWAKTEGKGEVHSWTTTERPLHPAHADTPYTLAVVALPEGPRILARLANIAPAEVRAGLPVRARFVAVDEDLTLVEFGPAEKEREDG